MTDDGNDGPRAVVPFPTQVKKIETMPNTAEFEALSPEAKTLVGAWWGVMMTTEVTFQRPWIIHPQARKGLDELVAAGYLSCEPLNQCENPPMGWKPTEKLKTEQPKVSRDFMKANSFPITDETLPEPKRRKRSSGRTGHDRS